MQCSTVFHCIFSCHNPVTGPDVIAAHTENDDIGSMELTSNVGYGVRPIVLNQYNDEDYVCAEDNAFYGQIELRHNAAYRSEDINEICDAVLYT